MLVKGYKGEEVYSMENAYVKPVAQLSKMEMMQPETCVAILLIIAIVAVVVI
jgi:hypothetical protein